MGKQTFVKRTKIIGIFFIVPFVMSIMVAVVSADDPCRYGPDTCKAPGVWREASPNDHICVLPEVHQQTINENALANQRRSPTGGIFGSNTCIAPYVWREAFPGDYACVPESSRAQAAQDNNAAASRKSCVPGSTAPPGPTTSDMACKFHVNYETNRGYSDPTVSTPVYFTDDSYATGPAGTINQRIWDFGDGPSYSTSNPDEKQASHSYEHIGDYHPTLYIKTTTGLECHTNLRIHLLGVYL